MNNDMFSSIGTSNTTFNAVKDDENKVESLVMPMNNDYVTKQELENSQLKQELLFGNIQSRSDVNFTKIDGKFDLLESKLDNFANSIPLVIDTKINEFKKESELKHAETIRFIRGTIVLGIISVIVALISLIK